MSILRAPHCVGLWGDNGNQKQTKTLHHGVYSLVGEINSWSKNVQRKHNLTELSAKKRYVEMRLPSRLEGIWLSWGDWRRVPWAVIMNWGLNNVFKWREEERVLRKSRNSTYKGSTGTGKPVDSKRSPGPTALASPGCWLEMQNLRPYSWRSTLHDCQTSCILSKIWQTERPVWLDLRKWEVGCGVSWGWTGRESPTSRVTSAVVRSLALF